MVGSPFCVGGTEKIPVPKQIPCWDRMENPAVPPGLTHRLRPLRAYQHTLTFGNGASRSGAHTQECPFLVALGSPLGRCFSAAITAPAALWEKRETAYSLFLNGLSQYSVKVSVCQEHVYIFLKKFIYMTMRQTGIAGLPFCSRPGVRTLCPGNTPGQRSDCSALTYGTHSMFNAASSPP